MLEQLSYKYKEYVKLVRPTRNVEKLTWPYNPHPKVSTAPASVDKKRKNLYVKTTISAG